jgi:hypothetical protein
VAARVAESSYRETWLLLEALVQNALRMNHAAGCALLEA